MSGWPLSPYAHPVPSFRSPIEPPSGDPDGGDAPVGNVCWNPEYTPYLLGAMSQLLLESTWKTDVQDVDITIGQMLNFQRLFGNATPCGVGASHTVTFDFAVDAGGWVHDTDEGTYITDVGWRTTFHDFVSGVWTCRLRLRYDFGSPKFVLGLRIMDGRINDMNLGLPSGRQVQIGAVTYNPTTVLESFHHQESQYNPSTVFYDWELGVSGIQTPTQEILIDIGFSTDFTTDNSSTMFIDLYQLRVVYCDLP